MATSEDFRNGFIEAWKTVMGNKAATPEIPAAPAIPAGQSAYQMGILRGLEAGKKRKGIIVASEI